MHFIELAQRSRFTLYYNLPRLPSCQMPKDLVLTHNAKQRMKVAFRWFRLVRFIWEIVSKPWEFALGKELFSAFPEHEVSEL